MRQISTFDAYLFDMGNTLLDFHQGSSDQEKDRLGVERLSIHLKEEYGLPVTADFLADKFLGPWLADFCLRSKGKELDVESYLNDALAIFQIKLGPAECQEAMKVWFSEYKNQVVVNPNAWVTLHHLNTQGKKVAVVSNSTLYADIFIDIFEHVGLAPFIHAFVFSYAYGARKPSAILFQEALKQFGLNPSQTVMVGDRLDTDLAGAQELGINTIWYNPSEKSLSGIVSPDYIISDFNQLIWEGQAKRDLQ